MRTEFYANGTLENEWEFQTILTFCFLWWRIHIPLPVYKVDQDWIDWRHKHPAKEWAKQPEESSSNYFCRMMRLAYMPGIVKASKFKGFISEYLAKRKEAIELAKSIPVQDRKWEAQADARTIADAKAIMGDPARMKAAANAAKGMIPDKQKELQGLKQVARKAK